MTDSGVSEPPATGTEPAPDAPSAGTHRVSRTAMVVAVLVALVVGVAVGGVIGWKVEQNRVKDDVSSAKAAALAKGRAQSQNVRPFGVVTAVTPTSVTFRLATGASGSKTFTISQATKVDRGVAGTPRTITKGATILVRPSPTSPNEAAEVIVLPKGTTFGAK